VVQGWRSHNNGPINGNAGILKSRVVGDGGDGAPHVETEGVSFAGVWAAAGDLVDCDSISTNDVGSVLRTLGVEAARATIVREVSKVFGVYGIGVDVRHLGLIADFMTHQARRRAAPSAPGTWCFTVFFYSFLIKISKK
jgi:DNA-directed RNA polymerase I subunit RPA1